MLGHSVCNCLSDLGFPAGTAAGLDISRTHCGSGDLTRGGRFGGEGGDNTASASEISSISRYGEEDCNGRGCLTALLAGLICFGVSGRASEKGWRDFGGRPLGLGEAVESTTVLRG